MIDGALLDSFVAFGATRNFTRAARAVGLSQPAFHERIQRLVEAVGQPLYERRGRELHLTSAGERLLAFAREQAARHEDLVAELRGQRPVRTVTLAAGEGAYLYLLGPALARYRGRVQLLTLGARATLEAVRSGVAQLGVAVVDLVPRGIAAEPIVKTPLCVALPARHPAARRRRLALADLRGERWILPPEGQLHRDLVSRAIARAGELAAEPLEADGWPLMLQFVALGLGLAIVNGICTAPRGVVVRPLDELGSVTYMLLARDRAELSPEAKALAAVVRG